MKINLKPEDKDQKTKSLNFSSSKNSEEETARLLLKISDLQNSVEE